METSKSYLSLINEFKINSNHNRYDLILICGTDLLVHHQKNLRRSDSFLKVLEQVYIASLLYKQTAWSKFCFNELKKILTKKNSSLLARLSGLSLEAKSDFSAAKSLYSDLLLQFPDDISTRKRFISVHRIQGQDSVCIEHLNRHLSEFPTDLESWEELASIYISHSSFEKAIFCYEELLIQDEQNLHTIITLAELYNMHIQLENSRKYYCMALLLDSKNIRALWGLIMVLTHDDQKLKKYLNLQQLLSSSIDKIQSVYYSLKASENEEESWISSVLSYINTLKDEN